RHVEPPGRARAARPRSRGVRRRPTEGPPAPRPPAWSVRTHGAIVWSKTQRSHQPSGVETGAFPGVAGHTGLVDTDQHCVTVAVQGNGHDPLGVPRRGAFHPVLTAAARPIGGGSRGEGAVQCLVVHPGEHEHLPRVVLLHDRGDQAVLVALQARGDVGGEVGDAHAFQVMSTFRRPLTGCRSRTRTYPEFGPNCSTRPRAPARFLGDTVSAESLSADLAGKPAALKYLAERFPRWDPYTALPALLDDEPVSVRFLGMGVARHACETAAARLRRAGIGAHADFASSAEEPPLGAETLVVGVSLGGGQRELCTALDR